MLSACLARPERQGLRRAYPVSVGIPSDASTATAHTPSGDIRVDYAKKMGVSPVALKDPALYHYIQDWMGVPHKMGGMKRTGVDCSGFVLMLYAKVYHKEIPRTSYAMADVVQKHRPKKLKEGDLVFFSFSGSRGVNHVGVYLHNDYFVHVSTSKGVILSKLTDPWYWKYYVKGGSLL